MLAMMCGFTLLAGAQRRRWRQAARRRVGAARRCPNGRTVATFVTSRLGALHLCSDEVLASLLLLPWQQSLPAEKLAVAALAFAFGVARLLVLTAPSACCFERSSVGARLSAQRRDLPFRRLFCYLRLPAAGRLPPLPTPFYGCGFVSFLGGALF